MNMQPTRIPRAVVAAVFGGFLTVAAAAASEDSWTLKAPLLRAQAPHASIAVANGNIYILGGNDRPCCDDFFRNIVQEYNPTTDTWSLRTPMPTNRGEAVAGTVANKIYIIGGRDISGPEQKILGLVEEYDPATDTWRTGLAPMPTPRCFLQGVTLGNKIYVISGSNEAGRLDTVEEYDPLTDTWRTGLASIPTKRDAGYAAALDGKIYVVGGWGDVPAPLPTERYDPATDTWTTVASNPVALGAHVAAIGANGRIYVFGGQDANGETLSSTEEYDPSTDTWTMRADMPLGVHAHGAATIGSAIYAVGGQAIGGGGPVKALQQYMPIPTSLPFLGFSPRAEFWIGPKTNDDSYWVRGYLKLAKTSNGIDPMTEAVTIKAGPFSHTLPAGSFRQEGTSYLFKGPVGASTLDVRITASSKPGGYSFKSCLKKADLEATTMKPQVQLTIGDDSGQANLDVGYAKFGKGTDGQQWVFPPAK